MGMETAEREVRNMKLHAPHFHIIATALPRERNVVLGGASPELVEALSTALRVLEKKGVRFAPSHQRRARRMISRNTAKRTKKELVCGKPGAASRGGGFFADACHTIQKMIPEMADAMHKEPCYNCDEGC